VQKCFQKIDHITDVSNRMTSVSEHNYYYKSCGDKCPLFFEPEEEVKEIQQQPSGYPKKPIFQKTGRTILTLCHRTHTFDEFTDMRGKDK
jgi:hypothetical protein